MFGAEKFRLTGIYGRDPSEAYSWIFDLLKVYGPFILFSAAPVFFVVFLFWRSAYKTAKTKWKRFVWLLCMVSPVAGLPMFLAIDWDRWFPILFISQCMLVVYVLMVNDPDAVEALKTVKTIFERHSLLFVVMLIYLASSVFSNNYSVYLSVMLKHIDSFLEFTKVA